MKGTTLLVAALVLSNFLLAGVLLWERATPGGLPTVEAQTVARGGKYLAVAGNINSNRMALYLIDESTDRMVIYLWDETRKTLRRLAYADLRADFQRPRREAATR